MSKSRNKPIVDGPDREFLLKRANKKIRRMTLELLRPAENMSFDHGGAYSMGLYAAFLKTAGWINAMILETNRQAGIDADRTEAALTDLHEKFFQLGRDEFYERIGDDTETGTEAGRDAVSSEGVATGEADNLREGHQQ